MATAFADASLDDVTVVPDLTGRGRGARGDTIFKGAAVAAAMAVLVILAGIAVSTTQRAWPAFSHQGLSFFTSTNWNPNTGHYGALAFIYGTVVVSGIAILIAVPISIGIALFMTELAPRRIRGWVRTVMDVLAAVPSVVFGLWGFLVLMPHLKGIFNSISDALSGIPVLRSIFGPSLSGGSFMTAGLILALMITPIVSSIAREVMQTVPVNDRNGAMALGATRWEMIRGVIFPHSIGGLVGAVMLGLGRALGETIAVALVIGATPQVAANLFAPGEAMPAVIARNLSESSGTFQAALIALGVTLFVLTIAINVSARKLVNVIDRRVQGTVA